jgi:hypothetical protein
MIAHHTSPIPSLCSTMKRSDAYKHFEVVIEKEEGKSTLRRPRRTMQVLLIQSERSTYSESMTRVESGSPRLDSVEFAPSLDFAQHCSNNCQSLLPQC